MVQMLDEFYKENIDPGDLDGKKHNSKIIHTKLDINKTTKFI